MKRFMTSTTCENDQVWRWYDHPLPIYSVIAAGTLRDLMTLTFSPFDLGQWSYIAGHVVNPSTKFQEPTAIRSWVMSSDISHGIPLTMRLQPLRMRRITWPMLRGKFSPDIWNPWPRFAYSLYNFYGATMTFKGRLLLAHRMFVALTTLCDHSCVNPNAVSNLNSV